MYDGMLSERGQRRVASYMDISSKQGRAIVLVLMSYGSMDIARRLAAHWPWSVGGRHRRRTVQRMECSIESRGMRGKTRENKYLRE